MPLIVCSMIQDRTTGCMVVLSRAFLMSIHVSLKKPRPIPNYLPSFCTLLVFLCLTCLSPTLAAQDRVPEPGADVTGTVLLQNVTLLDRAGKTGDVLVNILIRDRKVDVVTQEEIATDTVEHAFDARKGVLLGKLDPGQPPSFLILDGDPRKDADLLLDTATHARFAIREGVILRNRLSQVVESGVKPKRSGWLAYTPPPMSLPGSYQDTSKWNRWDTKPVSGIFLGALALDRQFWRSQDANSLAQVGNLNSFDGGEIRALRFGAVGTLNFPQPWVYTVFGATHAFDKGFDTDTTDNAALFDWRVDIPTFAKTTLSVGKQKEPISLERNMSLIYLPMQERAAVSDALLPSRNVGIVLSGLGFDDRVTWAGGVFNDWLDTNDSFSDAANQYIGRVTALPWSSPDDSNLVHLGFGLRYTDAKEGLRYGSEPEFNQSPNFVDTGAFSANSALTYNVEASWRKGPVWILGEYVLNDVDAPQLGNPGFSGYYLSGAWSLTGEMRSYIRRSGVFSPLPIAKSVKQGGWGSWEVAARWSELDLTDGLVTGGEMQIASLGLNWWLTPTFSFNINLRQINLDRFGVEGESTGINSRIVLLLE